MEFFTNIYKTLIDDYIHLHQNHGHHIEDIYKKGKSATEQTIDSILILTHTTAIVQC